MRCNWKWIAQAILMPALRNRAMALPRWFISSPAWFAGLPPMLPNWAVSQAAAAGPKRPSRTPIKNHPVLSHEVAKVQGGGAQSAPSSFEP